MELKAPALFAAAAAPQPPLHVRLEAGDSAGRRWPVMLRVRAPTGDLGVWLVDPPDPPDAITTLWVYAAGRAWRFPVAVTAVPGPVALCRITYQGPPQSADRRQEWRQPITLTGTVDGRGGAHASITYDVSPHAVRCWVPWRAAAGDRLAARWRWGQGVVAGTLTVVRLDPVPIWWHGRPGWATVGRWTDWAPDMAARWHAWCWQWAPAEDRG